jgi:Asp-tRNA(Asn)/Glu-tRNA(Gln) amidotransferase A subunit family amidase
LWVAPYDYYLRIADILIDDPEIYDGAHVSLQIVGKRLQEEKMLAIAAHVEALLAQSK